MDIREKLSWKGLAQVLPREAIKSPSLETFKKCGCGTWGHDLVVNTVVVLC